MAATDEHADKLLGATFELLRLTLGNLGDLPLDLADTVANVAFRHCESVFFFDPWINPFEKIRRGVEFEGITKCIHEFREAREKGADEGIMDYMKEFYINVFKYRIENVENKMPIRCLLERKFRRINDIPDLAKKLNLYQ